jgi:2-methylcitrate dehydratase PrpD
MAGIDTGGSDRPDFARDFADVSSRLRVADLSAAALDMVRADLVDTLACAIAGINAPGVQELIGLVTDWGGKPEGLIWCSPNRVPAHHAAWVNGMMSHACDFDDTHDAAVLHAGVSVIPAALAAAERHPGATDDDLLAGIASGLELICRLGMATTVGIIESGYMYTSLFGHFAATAAAARVAGLDSEQTVNALGIAYSQAAGNHQVTRDGALTKRMQPGFAAKTGIVSVALTQAGIKGVYRPFEGVDGLFRTYLQGRYDPSRLRHGLGEHWELTELSFKRYPCCRFNHTAIDAALDIRRQLPEGARVERIVAGVNRQTLEAVGTPLAMRQNPRTVVQAQFSLPYTVGCALARGTVSVSDFTPEALADPLVRTIAPCVEVVVDDGIEQGWSRGVAPARLIVETDRGTFEARSDVACGNRQAPMSAADFRAKLQGCIASSGLVWPDTLAQDLTSAVLDLGTTEGGSRRLLSLLVPRD